MKIVELTSQISRHSAGVWEVVAELSGALIRESKLDVRVLGIEGGDTAIESVRLPKGTVQAASALGFGSFGYAPGMVRMLNEISPDIIHSHGLWMYPSLLSERWGRWSGRPRIVSPHGMLDGWALRNRRWRKCLAFFMYEKRNLTRSTAIHALNERERMAIRGLGIAAPIAIVPNGVRLVESRRYEAPWDVEWAAGKKVLLYLGRIHRKKGIDMLIDALIDLRRKGSSFMEEWVVAVVGWGEREFEGALKEKVSEGGVEKSVLFVGGLFGEDKQAAYACADAFILPSLSEGLPMVVLEAWSHSLPVLITSECNLPCGAAVGAAIDIEPSSISISIALESMNEIADEELVRMGKKGRRLVEREYSWEVVADKMAEVYAWVNGGGTEPRHVEIV